QTNKRSCSPALEEASSKRLCTEPIDTSNTHLLTQLTDVLAEIRSTPSTGEISAELLGSLKLLMLQIEHLSADENNVEAKQMKDESDRCLETWFDELVARCEADGELDIDALEHALALALALKDEEEELNDAVLDNNQGDEVVVVDEEN
ncbi:uncharacterized protein BYT42DRAFT_485443, partial [Radiomyces spectabilis]|uniref:uncharacterized protein n=1 Tax=Radiomyces spectabilis TaxID=64574 RepID=UPI00221F88C1